MIVEGVVQKIDVDDRVWLLHVFVNGRNLPGTRPFPLSHDSAGVCRGLEGKRVELQFDSWGVGNNLRVVEDGT